MKLMASACRLFLLAVLGLFSAVAAEAHAPHDPVYGLGVSPNYLVDKTIFLATNAEVSWGHLTVLRSRDGGLNWEQLPKGMESRGRFCAIRVSPDFETDHSVIAVAEDGVYFSKNEGNSWYSANEGLPYPRSCGKLQIVSKGGHSYVMFLSLEDGSLFRRLSSEAVWKRLLPSVSDTRIVATSPDYVLHPAIFVADSKGNLKVSTDDGLSWEVRGTPTGGAIYDMAIAPGFPMEVFLAGGRRGMYYSADGAKTFLSRKFGLPMEAINRVSISPNYPADRVVFCTSITKAVFRSANSGKTWAYSDAHVRITGQIEPENEFSELQVSSGFSTDRTVFLSTFDGLYVSKDGGVTWVERQTRRGLLTGLALSPKFPEDRAVLTTSYEGKGMHRSTDLGSTWKEIGWIDSGLTPTFYDVRILPTGVGSPVTLAARRGVQLGVSGDLGSHWSVFNLPAFPELGRGAILATVIGAPASWRDLIYLGTRAHGVLKSSDGGKSWIRLADLKADGFIVSLEVSGTNPENTSVYAGVLNGEVWRNRGLDPAWTRVGDGIITSRSGRKLMSVSLSPDYGIDGFALVGTNDGLFMSGDGGDHWKRLELPSVGKSFVVQQVLFSPDFGRSRSAYVVIRGKGFFELSFDSSGQLISTADIGASLLDRNIQFTEFQLSPDFEHDGTILGVARFDVWRSTNRGASWELAGRPGT